jgi:hypothetical protein
MQRLKYSVFTALGFAALAAVLSILDPTPSKAANNSTANVFVTNTGAAPVPVTGSVNARDIDGPARNGIMIAGQINLGLNASGTQGTVYTVPAGKRLVIEGVSAQLAVDHDAGALAELLIQNLVTNPGIYLPATLARATPTFDFYAVNQLVRAYADTGTELVFAVSQNAGASQPYAEYVTVSGYLIDYP